MTVHDAGRCAYPDTHGVAFADRPVVPTYQANDISPFVQAQSICTEMDECCLPPLDSRCGDCAESNLSRLAEPPPKIRFKLPSRSSFRDAWVGNIHALFPALIPTDPFFGRTRIRASTPFAVLNDQSSSSITPASSAESVSCVHQLMV